MSLLDAAESLDQLASGQLPSQKRVLPGLHSLDPLLLQDGCEQALLDVAPVLEVFVATGGVLSLS